MKIVFFGSSSFAVPSLEALIAAGRSVSCVVTQPDRSKGRGLLDCCTQVKSAALKHNLKLCQPESINSPEAIGFLERLDADLFIVVSYGQILSAQVLAVPKLFSLNIHASLLPRYRGAAPVNWAIINGDTSTGVTIIRMNERMDSGEIAAQEKMDIEECDNALTLEDKLAVQGACLLFKCLEDIEKGGVKFIPQEESRQTAAPKLKKSDGLIDWQLPAQRLVNLVRGTAGWPGSFTYYREKLLKIFKARAEGAREREDAALPGQITGAFRKGISVATASGSFVIEELQIEGGRRMGAEEFISGHKISVGESLKTKK